DEVSEQKNGPGGGASPAGAANNDYTASVAHTIDNFSRRIVVDALSGGLSATWHRRAEALESARPRPTDYRGKATPAQIAEQDRRLALKAQNARDHASIVAFHDANDMIADVLNGGDRP